jgi:hypothetical protein
MNGLSGPLTRRPRAAFYYLSAAALLLALSIAGAGAAAEPSDGYRMIDWIELIPDDDLDALMNPPDVLSMIADGSAQDIVPGESDEAVYGLDEQSQRYEAALQSTAVKSEFDGQKVRIPGFVVPLAFDETRMISEFLLVPYFGACLHSPPPPPNQIIHSRFTGGLSVEDIYDPYWLEGTLSVGVEATELGTAAYRIDVDRVSLYYED